MLKGKIVKIELARKQIGLILSLLLIGLGLYLVATVNKAKTICQESYKNDLTVRHGEYRFITEVSDTNEERNKGLSDRLCIDESNAMLFVFDNSDKHGFWMKDMRFAIDIVWLDDSKKVVSIKEYAQPESYPEIFYPSSNSKYVVELAPGTAKEVGLNYGSQLEFD